MTDQHKGRLIDYYRWIKLSAAGRRPYERRAPYPTMPSTQRPHRPAGLDLAWRGLLSPPTRRGGRPSPPAAPRNLNSPRDWSPVINLNVDRDPGGRVHQVAGPAENRPAGDRCEVRASGATTTLRPDRWARALSFHRRYSPPAPARGEAPGARRQHGSRGHGPAHGAQWEAGYVLEPPIRHRRVRSLRFDVDRALRIRTGHRTCRCRSTGAKKKNATPGDPNLAGVLW